MREFDFKLLRDEAVRFEYATLLARADEMARSLHRAYGSGRLPIEAKFFHDDSYNAEADEIGDRYLIRIGAAVPLLNLILFGRLLSDRDILPSLDSSGPLASNYALPAIIDPSNFSLRSDWKVELSPIRAFAAGTLADLCSTFVICHELGHVACGHVEGMRAHEGRSTVCELVKTGGVRKTDFDRRQAWEFDADIVACSLMMNFLDELWKDTENNQRTANLFGRGEGALIEVLSISIVSLFSFFCYLKGTGDAMDFKSTHPHPLVRAYYIKDVLFNLSATRWSIDLDAVGQSVDTRLDEFLKVLNNISLFGPSEYKTNSIRKIENSVLRLKKTQAKYRRSCSQWSWIDWG